jgi:hypothetical protein
MPFEHLIFLNSDSSIMLLIVNMITFQFDNLTPSLRSQIVSDKCNPSAWRGEWKRKLD